MININNTRKETKDEELDDISGNWNNLKWYQKLMINITLFLGNLIRSDIHKCPKCGRLTVARLASVTFYGWRFKTKCHRCDHVFEWNSEI